MAHIVTYTPHPRPRKITIQFLDKALDRLRPIADRDGVDLTEVLNRAMHLYAVTLRSTQGGELVMFEGDSEKCSVVVMSPSAGEADNRPTTLPTTKVTFNVKPYALEALDEAKEIEKFTTTDLFNRAALFYGWVMAEQRKGRTVGVRTRNARPGRRGPVTTVKRFLVI